MKKQQGGSGRKIALTAEVSCQEGIWLNCCIDRITKSLKENIWRSWKEARSNGKVENSFGGRISKGGIMS